MQMQAATNVPLVQDMAPQVKQGNVGEGSKTTLVHRATSAGLLYNEQCVSAAQSSHDS